jgi:uncharacterized phiE125 gp8 family phage protein
MAEPVSLAEAKAHLRVTSDHENTLIESYIVAAREWVENYTGYILVSRQIVETFSSWGGPLTLHNRPISALGEITYTDADGDETVYADGVLRTFTYPAKIYPPSGSTFPTLGTDGGITVNYTAGYATAADVPHALKQAMLLLIGYWHVNREAEAPAGLSQLATASGVPHSAIVSLCRPYRGAVLA